MWIVVGIVLDAQGRVLLARRHPDSHQGGLWEFPGGKREPGESAAAALHRELLEEVGLEAGRPEPWMRVVHAYPDRQVSLDVWRVEAWSGRPRGREGQALEWVAPDDLAAHPMPAANRAIVNALRLPGLYVISDQPRGEKDFLSTLEAVLAGGCRLFRLRARMTDGEAYRALAATASRLCAAAGARLMLDTDPALVQALHAGGLHMTSRELMACNRRPLAEPFLVGASCHNAAELAHAKAIGADFAVLSPVRATISHPDAEPIGWEGFRQLVYGAGIPVYALGGMQAGDLAAARGRGGQGIAMLGGIWRADDPAVAVREALRQKRYKAKP